MVFLFPLFGDVVVSPVLWWGAHSCREVFPPAPRAAAVCNFRGRVGCEACAPTDVGVVLTRGARCLCASFRLSRRSLVGDRIHARAFKPETPEPGVAADEHAATNIKPLLAVKLPRVGA